MKFIPTEISGLIVIEPKVIEDQRGHFFESYRMDKMDEAGIQVTFVQDNQSKSEKNVLRGLHFQNPPFEQGKLIRVITGSVLDVAVDIRKNSPTYGKWHSIKLSGKNKKMFWIPPGFAHGFVSLEDNTIFTYKCTNVYNKNSEGSIRWNDPRLNIEWGIEEPKLSEKDMKAPLFSALESKF